VLRRCRFVWRRTETQSLQMVRNFHQLFSGIEFPQAVNADPNCPRDPAPAVLDHSRTLPQGDGGGVASAT
jgi:hypothetical protein